MSSKSKPASSKPIKTNDADKQKTFRYQFSGKNSDRPQKQPSANSSKSPINPKQIIRPKSSISSITNKSEVQSIFDITIMEDHTAEQLDDLARKYDDILKISTNKMSSNQAKSSGVTKKLDQKPTSSKLPAKKQPSLSKLKPLATMTERRQELKQKLQSRAEASDITPQENDVPKAQNKEAAKVLERQAMKATQEYGELVKNSRPRVNLVVVGHVDAGKSTLVGHLLFKLGQVSGKQMHRNEVDSQRSGKASFKFAWALDETIEERARGVTVDLALTKFETPKKDVVLMDAPGHVDFVPAVITGAAQADAALLVVDATRGEFETGFSSGGQTQEHTFLVRSLGVKSLVVVVNKMDNVNWSSDRFTDIIDQLKPFLKRVGFNLEQDVQFVVCSGMTGENLVERRMDKLLKESCHPQLVADQGIDWKTMPSLVEAIDNMKQPERMVDKPTRVCVTDVFKGMSSGVFLGAKVVAGKIEVKQKLLLLPPNETCEVKQIEVREDKESRAFAGDIITATVTGLDMNKFYRGCLLCDPQSPCLVTNRFQARIITLNNADVILIKGTPIEAHINGTFESGEVKKLISLLNKNTGESVQKTPRCIVKNSSAIIQLQLDRVVCCELYETNKDLGRFMLRCCGKTIAAGLITKLKTPKVNKAGTKFKS